MAKTSGNIRIQTSSVISKEVFHTDLHPGEVFNEIKRVLNRATTKNMSVIK